MFSVSYSHLGALKHLVSYCGSDLFPPPVGVGFSDHDVLPSVSVKYDDKL